MYITHYTIILHVYMYMDRTCTYMYMTLIIHEMLRKTRQVNTTQQKDKATQHNLPKQIFFQEKLAASGGTQTHDHPLSRQHSNYLSYRGSSVGWARIMYIWGSILIPKLLSSMYHIHVQCTCMSFNMDMWWISTCIIVHVEEYKERRASGNM